MQIQIVYCEVGMVIGYSIEYPNSSYIQVNGATFITKDKDEERRGNNIFKFTKPPLMWSGTPVKIPYNVIHFISILDPETSIYKEYVDMLKRDSEKVKEAFSKKEEPKQEKKKGRSAQVVNLAPKLHNASS